MEELMVVEKKLDCKNINYCDGYMKTTFTFNRDVTEEEFLEFCKQHHMELRKKEEAAWYEDYGVITKISDNVWEHKRVMRYTD